jgi:hypothetical protein
MLQRLSIAGLPACSCGPLPTVTDWLHIADVLGALSGLRAGLYTYPYILLLDGSNLSQLWTSHFAEELHSTHEVKIISVERISLLHSHLNTQCIIALHRWLRRSISAALEPQCSLRITQTPRTGQGTSVPLSKGHVSDPYTTNVAHLSCILCNHWYLCD